VTKFQLSALMLVKWRMFDPTEPNVTCFRGLTITANQRRTNWFRSSRWIRVCLGLTEIGPIAS